MKLLWTFCICCLNFTTISAQDILIKAGMKISGSVKIQKKDYRIDAAKDQPLILIEGNNIIIDFNNATLQGSNMVKNPDEFTGNAILIQNSKHVTIKNLHAAGYKIALLARNVQWLTLDHCDLSYNYRQHLNSTQEKEDISDWMSYHHNEKDEWLRYGAAFYLVDCNDAIIRNCKVTGGQNALMMNRCNNGYIYHNDFSYNSGIGIGLYRSSNNNIISNKVIYNVRGYSHGIYSRGQDSAGMLVYEQSNNNRFYYNNVTHSGDGFFLWAGQTTMDKGTGGCNGNILYKNDFSYAPTNGIEVTFSSNLIYGNKISGCDHGIWGGYSFETSIEENSFSNNRIAIAIEHGLKNRIINNKFDADNEAIRLWARKEQPSDWGYAKYRDTRSAHYTIAGNEFNNIPIAFNLNRTDSLYIHNNQFLGSSTIKFKQDSTVKNLDSVTVNPLDDMITPVINIDLPGSTARLWDPFRGSSRQAGRESILITEWGPYDFNYPIIWNTNPTDTTDLMKFDLYGPEGNWKIISMKGVKNISKRTGSFYDSISAEKIKNDISDIEIELEFTGNEFTDALGKIIPADKKHRFSFKKFFQPMNWDVLFFAVDTISYNPVKETTLFPANVRMMPFKTEKVNKLDYAWWGGIKTDKQYNQFLTIAEATEVFLPGTYEIAVTWDDAVRLYIDDKLVLNEWNPSLYDFDESPNKKIKIVLGGKHHFRVEHVELGGFATLSLKLKKLP